MSYAWQNVGVTISMSLPPVSCSCGGLCPAYLPAVAPMAHALNVARHRNLARMQREYETDLFHVKPSGDERCR